MAGKNLITEIRAWIECDAADLPPPEKSRLQLDKWRLIHKHVHDNPFPTNARLARSEQWRRAANHIRGRKRKALAVHKWLLSADGSATASEHTLTDDVLERHRIGKSGGTENL